ncbi:hypothetical protein BH23BAC1_BH23BAC1_03950 [soil metagenome]
MKTKNWFFKFIITFSILFQVSGTTSSAQAPADTLLFHLSEIHDTSRVILLNKFAEKYLETFPAKAFERASEALDLSIKLHDEKSRATALRNLGQAHIFLLVDYEKALEYCFEALRIEEGLNLKTGEALTLKAIGAIYEEVGNFPGAIQHNKKALKILKSDNNQGQVSILHNKIGKIFSKLKQYDSALLYHNKALEYELAQENKKGEANVFNAIANVYTALGNTGEAYHYHTRALTIRREIKDKQGEAQSLNYIAEIYKKRENYIRAEKNHLVALDIYKKLNNIKGLADTYNGLGEIYLKQKKYQLSQEHLKKGLNYALEMNDKNNIRFSYDLLYASHFAQKNYKEALENKNYFLAIDEFIHNEDNEKKIAELQSMYDLNKKESEIMALKINQQLKEMQLKGQENFRNILIVSLGFSGIILILILYLYRSKQQSNLQLKITNEQIKRKNEELQEANATKDKFFSIIAHDLRGPLHSLSSFSNLLINHTSSLSMEDIQMVAKDLDKSLNNLFSLLENLLEWARSQAGIIEYNPEKISLRQIISSTIDLLEISAQNKNISIQTSVSEHLMVIADKYSITTVIRNLISNAIKFTHEGGKIEIGAIEISNFISIRIKDNGVGMNSEVQDKLFRIDNKYTTKGTKNEKGTGLGLILCKEFVEKNGGKITVESKENQGTVFSFNLPKAEMEGQLILELN